MPAGMPRSPSPTPVGLRGRHIEVFGDPEGQAVAGLLKPFEVLLACLAVEQPVQKELPGRRGLFRRGHFLERGRYLMTDTRAALLFVTQDSCRWRWLDRAPLRLEPRGRRTLVHVGSEVFLPLRNAQLFEEVAELNWLASDERIRQAARLSYALGKSTEKRFGLSLLDAGASRGDPWAGLAAWLAAVELDEPRGSAALTPFITALLQGSPPAGTVADLFQSFGFGRVSGSALLTELRRGGFEPWAIELHERMHARLPEREAQERLRSDLELAEHALELGLARRACQLLEPAFTNHEANLTFLEAESKEEQLLARVYSTLARARAYPTGLDQACAERLVQLRPLSEERLSALAASVREPPRKSRVLEAIALLDRGGISTQDTDFDTASTLPLKAHVLQDWVVHPAAGQHKHLIELLRRLVAELPMPDRAHLADFCQVLTATEFPQACQVLEACSRALGISRLIAFVSRGNKAVGMRAFEGSPPFIVIGGRHLAPDDAYRMTPRELAFAFGAELAHLRFGHQRVTPRELWAGALTKTGAGVDLLASALPALRGVRLADSVQRGLRKLPSGALTQLSLAATRLGRALSPDPSSSVLAPLRQELVLGSQLFQLSADRAGLLMCQELAAAARAMLKLHPELYPALQELQDGRLADVLLTEPFVPERRDVALRIGALIPFYVSERFTRLLGELSIDQQKSMP